MIRTSSVPKPAVNACRELEEETGFSMPEAYLIAAPNWAAGRRTAGSCR